MKSTALQLRLFRNFEENEAILWSVRVQRTAKRWRPKPLVVNFRD